MWINDQNGQNACQLPLPWQNMRRQKIWIYAIQVYFACTTIQRTCIKMHIMDFFSQFLSIYALETACLISNNGKVMLENPLCAMSLHCHWTNMNMKRYYHRCVGVNSLQRNIIDSKTKGIVLEKLRVSILWVPESIHVHVLLQKLFTESCAVPKVKHLFSLQNSEGRKHLYFDSPLYPPRYV